MEELAKHTWEANISTQHSFNTSNQDKNKVTNMTISVRKKVNN